MEAHSSKRGRQYDDDDYEGGKRKKVEGMTEIGKENVIVYVLRLAYALCVSRKIPLTALDSVIGSTQIMATCYRIHDYARGKKNVNVESEKTKKRNIQDFTLEVDGVTYNISSVDALGIWDVAFRVYKDLTNRPALGFNDFFGETATIIALMALFGQRLKELQIGPDSWVSTKREGNTFHHKLSTYGISSAYRHMASGLSWEVGIRNTLAKHTTGLCQLAILSNAKGEKKYSNKTKTNVSRDYSFLEHIDIISEFIQSNDKKTNVPILDRMAKITHLHGDKHKRRCSPPLSAFWKIFGKHVVNLGKKSDVPAVVGGGMEVEGQDPTPIAPLLPVGFSSKKAVLLYNSCKDIKIPENCNAELFKEAYFHAFFGTQGEDFGILTYMTGRASWNTREKFTNEFFKEQIKPKNKTRADSIQAIVVSYYSKSISATQSNMLSAGGSIVGTMPTFAGYRTQRFTKEEVEFAMRVKGASVSSIESSSAAIIDYLNDIIKMLVGEIGKGVNKGEFFKECGRTNWYSVEGAGYEKDQNGTIQAGRIEEVGKSFWSHE